MKTIVREGGRIPITEVLDEETGIEGKRATTVLDMERRDVRSSNQATMTGGLNHQGQSKDLIMCTCVWLTLYICIDSDKC